MQPKGRGDDSESFQVIKHAGIFEVKEVNGKVVSQCTQKEFPVFLCLTSYPLCPKLFEWN